MKSRAWEIRERNYRDEKPSIRKVEEELEEDELISLDDEFKEKSELWRQYESDNY